MEKLFGTIKRGHKHRAPSKEADVTILIQSYQASKVHCQVPGREFEEKSDCAVDVVTNGFNSVQMGDTIKKWAGRRNFERGTTEDY